VKDWLFGLVRLGTGCDREREQRRTLVNYWPRILARRDERDNDGGRCSASGRMGDEARTSGCCQRVAGRTLACN
jgi:hypothetical protein